jgi:hypothetical protein
MSLPSGEEQQMKEEKRRRHKQPHSFADQVSLSLNAAIERELK